ncbi:hypothetical protein F5Y18DRAFT_429804 [Xylariaceae sp. FL1019]|nr:hypothetical protein F5Y18DRAFT_429804 [Xylariaceae sp. FL1019]
MAIDRSLYMGDNHPPMAETESRQDYDWIMLAATILQIVYQALITVDMEKGAGKTMAPTFSPFQLVELLKCSWVSTPFAIAVSVIARLSIAIFLIPVFSARTWYKCFMIVFMAMLLIIVILNIIIVFVQVKPSEPLWNVRIMASRWYPSVQQTSSSVLHGKSPCRENSCFLS